MADKTKTIKGATDTELDELVKRLRKENELQNLIAEIKRKSIEGYVPYDQNVGISTEAPIESMYHFGIPGMKWGRRRGKSSGPSRPSSEEHTTKEMLSKKKLRELSNSDIKTLNERLQLERQYRDLTKKQMSPGKKFIMDLLVNQGKQLVTAYIAKNGVGNLKDTLGKIKTKPVPKPILKKRTIGFQTA